MRNNRIIHTLSVRLSNAILLPSVARRLERRGVYHTFLLVMLRIDFVTNSKIHDNTIENCGVYDFQFDDGGKTGEGICE